MDIKKVPNQKHPDLTEGKYTYVLFRTLLKSKTQKKYECRGMHELIQIISPYLEIDNGVKCIANIFHNTLSHTATRYLLLLNRTFNVAIRIFKVCKACAKFSSPFLNTNSGDLAIQRPCKNYDHGAAAKISEEEARAFLRE